MATEPTPDTPSAAELAEALRRLVAIEPGATIAAETLLARYDAAQKSPLDALLAWAPWPWRVVDATLMAGVAQPIAYVTTEVELCGHDAALLRFFAAAPHMLDALREYNQRMSAAHGDIAALPEGEWHADARAVWSKVNAALAAAGDKP